MEHHGDYLNGSLRHYRAAMRAEQARSQAARLEGELPAALRDNDPENRLEPVLDEPAPARYDHEP